MNVEVGFFSVAQVCGMTTLSRTTLWRLVDQGTFPKPVPLSRRRVGWPKQVVLDWMTNRNLPLDAKIASTATARHRVRRSSKIGSSPIAQVADVTLDPESDHSDP